LWVVKDLRKFECHHVDPITKCYEECCIECCELCCIACLHATDEEAPDELSFTYSSKNFEIDFPFDTKDTVGKLLTASLHKNPELLYVQNIYYFAHFVYIACTLSSASGWQRFQELFARWLNSGSGMNAVVNCICLRIQEALEYQIDNENTKKISCWDLGDAHCVIQMCAILIMGIFCLPLLISRLSPLLLLLVSLITHSFPMAFAYIWIFLIIRLLYIRVMDLLLPFFRKLLPSPVQVPAQILPWYSPTWFLLSSVAHLMDIGIFTFSHVTFFNYGLLL
jgi:hypothetical protein